jgi:hypothetical protein
MQDQHMLLIPVFRIRCCRRKNCENGEDERPDQEWAQFVDQLLRLLLKKKEIRQRKKPHFHEGASNLNYSGPSLNNL